MRPYLELLQRILDEGRSREDRTGVGTFGIFGAQLRFDLAESFPLMTTKKLPFRLIVRELLWFLSGDTHVRSLREQGVHIWDPWATAEECARFDRAEGDLGPIYGHQWRNFGASKHADGTYADDGVDQLARVVESLRERPWSRRHLVTAWHPREAEEVTLPPCHTLFQFHVQDDELRCQLYQRSGDVFIGVPFNIASYALLTRMIAHVTGLRAVEFIHTLGDAHLYGNHLEQARTQLAREPRPRPTVHLNPERRDLFAFRYEDVELRGYRPHPHIKAPVAV